MSTLSIAPHKVIVRITLDTTRDSEDRHWQERGSLTVEQGRPIWSFRKLTRPLLFACLQVGNGSGAVLRSEMCFSTGPIEV